MSTVMDAPPAAPAASTPPAAPATPPAAPAPDSKAPPTAPTLSPWTDHEGKFASKDWATKIGHPELAEKFSSVEALGKSYKSLEKTLSQDKIPVPKEGASKEEMDAFYNRLGRPATPDNYQFQKPKEIPDEAWDKDQLKGFSEAAHALGLTQKQAEGMIAFDLKRQGGMGEKLAALPPEKREELVSTIMQPVRDAAAAALKKEWGGDFDTNLTMAKRTAMTVGGEELLADPKLANNPLFIRAMAKVGEMLGENKVPGLRGDSAAASQSVQGELDAIFANKNDPYFLKGHPSHQERVDYVARLFQRKSQG